MKVQNLNLYRGDSYRIDISLTNNKSIKLGSLNIKCEVKDSMGYVIYSPNISITSDMTMSLIFNIPSDVLKGQYFYDVELKDYRDVTETVLKGRMYIIGDVSS